MKVKIRRIVINPEMLFHIMQDNTAWRVTKGIPKGAQLRGFTLDPYTQALHLFVEDESFEAVDVGTVCPQHETLFKKIV
jgi:hypothetical protein